MGFRDLRVMPDTTPQPAGRAPSRRAEVSSASFRRIGFALSLCALASFAGAQELFRVRPDRPVQEEDLKFQKPAPAPLPEIQVPPAAAPEGRAPAGPTPRIRLQRIDVSGSTVFSEAELQEVTKPFLNRELANEDLEALRRAVTLLYVNKGYVNSGAVLPDQALKDGTLKIQVVEGELSRIDVEGRRWFRDGYLQRRLALDAGPPLNLFRLQKSLLLLQTDPRIERLNAELRPGVQPGQSVLAVNVQEQVPYDLRFDVNNYHSPTVGAVGGYVTAGHRNLTSNGDRLSVMWGRTEGLSPQIDASYSLPLTARDTTVSVRYRRNDYEVVEQPFEPLDVKTESEAYEISLWRPFYRSPEQEFRAGVTGERIHDETSLLGDPFSFTPGADDGESTVTALRLFQDWTWRSQSRVLAAYSRVSFGVDALGATTHSGDVPDSRYAAWLGQVQWAELLPFAGIQSIARLVVQLANDPLLPEEQIAIGGRYSVRGYRENQLVRDNGLIASIEARLPLVTGKVWAEYLQLAPFADYGRGWNREVPTPDPTTITSAGVGLRWGVGFPGATFYPRLQAELYWGHAFKDIHNASEYDLQDDGIHFQATLSMF